MCLWLAAAGPAAAQRVGDITPDRISDVAAAAVSDVRFPAGLPVTDGLILHLAADAIEGLNHGDGVALWQDASSHSNHAQQASAALRPVYFTNVVNGLPALRFNNASLITTESVSFGDWTMFAVFRDSGVSDHERLLDHDYVNGWWWGRNATTANRWGGGVRENSSPWGRFVTLADGEWHLFTNLRSGSAHVLRGNGGAVATSGTVSAAATALNPIGIGSWFNDSNSGQRATQMDIGEIVIFERTLSEAELQAVEQYLGVKWLRWISDPPGAPGEPVFSDVYAHNLRLSWTEPSEGGPPDLYQVERAPDIAGVPGAYSQIVVTANTFYDDTGLTAETACWYRVRAANAYGVGPYGPAAQVTTTDQIGYPGLILWLAADTLTGLNDGDAVAVWADQSGVDNHAIQNNAALRPVVHTNGVSGLPAVRFNGSSLLTTNAVSFGDWTIFVVFRDAATVTTYERLLDHSFQNGWWWGRNGGAANSWGGGVRETEAPYGRFITLADGQWHLVVNQREGTTHRFIGNGGAVSTSGTVTDAATTLNRIGIGSWFDDSSGAQRASQMDIAEIRVFDRALGETQRQQIENELGQKWLGW